jgi:hypothetical protein
MHRRPVRMATPAELIMFHKDDWPGPEWVCWSDDRKGVSWDSPFQRWIDARRAYSKAHPDSALGSLLDQMRFEHQTLYGPPRNT